MKLLILGINYAPEMIGIAKYTTELAEDMAGQGHEVRVIAAQPYYPGWKVFPGFPRWRYGHESRGRLSVTRCPLYVPAHPTGPLRLLHHASFAVTATLAALWSMLWSRPDVVFVVAPSLLSAPVGWLVARISGAASWLHVQDFEVEAAFATGLLRADGPLGRAARRFEAGILRRFDRVSTISRPMLAKLLEKGVAPDRICELRNWADLAGVAPVAASSFRQAFGITTPHVALYSGNIGNKQGLEILAEAAQHLRHRDDLSFVICGDGSFLPELKRLAKGSRMVFMPLQPREKLGDLLGLAQVHLLPQMAGAADLVLPSKLTNMLASGRPVVATAAPGTALAEEVAGCGLVVAPGDARGLAEAIEKLLDDPALAAALGAAGRVRALARWDGAVILPALSAEFEALLVRAPVLEGGLP